MLHHKGIAGTEGRATEGFSRLLASGWGSEGSGALASAVTEEDQLWQRVSRSVTLFGELPPNRTQAMTLTHSGGALIPEIVRRGFQDVPEAVVSRCHWSHAP